MARPKKTTELATSAPANDDDASVATSSSDTSAATKLRPRGRHVAGWLETRFGEGTGRDWPKAVEDMWPILRRTLAQADLEGKTYTTRDFRVKVSRLNGAADKGETALGTFDASCVDVENAEQAIIDYLDEWFVLPSEKAGIEGACTLRVTFQDKNTGQMVKSGDYNARPPREIKAIRAMRSDARAYEGNAPATSAAHAASATRTGDPYTADALHNLRVELAQERTRIERELAELRAMRAGAVAATEPTAAAAAPPAPGITKTELVETIVEVMARLKSSEKKEEDESDKLAKRIRQKIDETAAKRMDKVLERLADDDDVVEAKAEIIDDTKPPPNAPPPAPAAPQHSAPFEGILIKGSPKYKGKDVLWSADPKTGKFSWQGFGFCNPELAMDFFSYLRDAGTPIAQALQKFMEQQGLGGVAQAIHEQQQNSTQNGKAHVTDHTPPGARDATPREHDPRQGAS